MEFAWVDFALSYGGKDMSAGPRDEKSIFATAVAMGTPAERQAYLDEACGADAALRARLAALLGAREDQNDFLDQFIPAPESRCTARSRPAARCVGRCASHPPRARRA